MKKQQKNSPYNFDVMREYRIYRNIGLNYRWTLFKKCRIRKVIKKNEEIFARCSEWECYIVSNYLSKFRNHGDFRCYLNEKLRICELILKIFDKIYIPLVLGEASLIFSNEEETMVYWIVLLVLFLLTLFLNVSVLVEFNGRKRFYNHCIQIIEGYNK